MKKTIVLLALFAMVFAMAPAAQAAVIVTPGDGYTGDYRIAFQTNGSVMADSSRTMADYNADVTAAAAAITELNDLGTTWTAIASTLAVDARDNTGTNPSSTGIPIYTTTGLRIADDNADLWDGTLLNPIFYGDGTTTVPDAFSEQAWTGTDTDGTQDGDGTTNSQDQNALSTGTGKFPDDSYPTNYLTITRGGKTDSSWITGPSSGDTDSRGHKIMGMSGVIAGIPEPATMSLLAIGGLGLLLMRRRRRA